MYTTDLTALALGGTRTAPSPNPNLVQSLALSLSLSRPFSLSDAFTTNAAAAYKAAAHSASFKPPGPCLNILSTSLRSATCAFFSFSPSSFGHALSPSLTVAPSPAHPRLCCDILSLTVALARTTTHARTPWPHSAPALSITLHSSKRPTPTLALAVGYSASLTLSLSLPPVPPICLSPCRHLVLSPSVSRTHQHHAPSRRPSLMPPASCHPTQPH